MSGLVFCLMGPTAAGKTAVAVEWAHQFPVDIISVDSAMIYRTMDIGTAKPDAATLARAPHKLIDILDPSQSYSAADFARDATREITASHQAGRIPLLVGGTMLYYRALQQGLSALPSADIAMRSKLQTQLEVEGVASLYAQLQTIDPIAAERIKPTDPQRIMRALEVYNLTGQPLSSLQQGGTPSPYRFINIGIIPDDRAALHQKIAERFHQMLAQGFIEEVVALKARGDLHLNLPSMRTVGYRQVWQYLEGELDYDQMVEQGIIATRQLAKRQLTWLRSWPALLPFQPWLLDDLL